MKSKQPLDDADSSDKNFRVYRSTLDARLINSCLRQNLQARLKKNISTCHAPIVVFMFKRPRYPYSVQIAEN